MTPVGRRTIKNWVESEWRYLEKGGGKRRERKRKKEKRLKDSGKVAKKKLRDKVEKKSGVEYRFERETGDEKRKRGKKKKAGGKKAKGEG